MKLARVDFINVVNFCGAIRSASSLSVSGERPGMTPIDIVLDEKMRFVRLSKTTNGKEVVKFVPVSNVSGFEVVDEEPAKPAAKK